MHRSALRYGLIASGIMIIFIVVLYFLFSPKTLLDLGEAFGYAIMVLSMTMVFIGIKRYRDNELNGSISFGQAFGMGVYIAFIGSFVYGVFEGIFYEVSDFKEVYTDFYMDKINNSGATPEVINQQIAEFNQSMAMWDNSFSMGIIMFLTVFILGIIIALVSAAILRKKPETIIT